jgi:hypothetical protein
VIELLALGDFANFAACASRCMTALMYETSGRIVVAGHSFGISTATELHNTLLGIICGKIFVFLEVMD